MARLVFVDGRYPEYVEALRSAGHEVATVASAKEAFAWRPSPDAIIVELTVPAEDLPRLSRSLKSARRTRAMTVIALTSAENEQAVEKAGLVFCRHPCPPQELVKVVEQAVMPSRSP